MCGEHCAGRRAEQGRLRVVRWIGGADRGAGAREDVCCVDGDAEALLDCVGADVWGAGCGEVVAVEDDAGVHEVDDGGD